MRIDKINLLPTQKRWKDLLIVNKRTILLLFAIELLLCTFHGLYQWGQRFKLNQQLAELQQESAGLESSLNMANQRQADLSAKTLKESAVQEIANKRNRWSNHFKELSLLLPQNLWLTVFDVESREGKLEIEIRGEGKGQDEIADFYYRLAHSVHYNQLIMQHSALVENMRPALYQFIFSTKEGPLAIRESEDAEAKTSSGASDAQQPLKLLGVQNLDAINSLTGANADEASGN